MARTQILIHSRGKEQGLARRRTNKGFAMSAAQASSALILLPRILFFQKFPRAPSIENKTVFSKTVSLWHRLFQTG